MWLHVWLRVWLLGTCLCLLVAVQGKIDLDAKDIIPDREEPITVPELHVVNGNRVLPPFPEHLEMAMLAMGCFWGVERKFWETKGVYSTHVGYSAGVTKHPRYPEVKSGGTGHAEVVRVLYDPKVISYTQLLQVFWENHDPTQGMRQGQDIGTQYRSGIYYYTNDQREAAISSRDAFQEALTDAGFGPITTEINPVTEFYYAEEYHQQYLHKNPDGYCGLAGTGVNCPSGLIFDRKQSPKRGEL